MNNGIIIPVIIYEGVMLREKEEKVGELTEQIKSLLDKSSKLSSDVVEVTNLVLHSSTILFRLSSDLSNIKQSNRKKQRKSKLKRFNSKPNW